MIKRIDSRRLHRLSLLAATAFLAPHQFAGTAVAADAPPADKANTQSADQPVAPKSPDASANGEIVVTAQKRSERLVDIPLAVSVVSTDALAKQGDLQFTDWANSVPGLNFSSTGAGVTEIVIRGVSVGFDLAPTVGIDLDGIPIGQSTPNSSSSQYTLDPGVLDVDHVEVLKGPQGTLYGASTMGGLIKYVSTVPNTTDWSGRITAGVAAIENGGVSYDVSGALNLPLKDNLAGLRINAFETHEGGYIDNVSLGQKNVNRSDSYGGRADLLLTPATGLAIRLGAVIQDIKRDGQASADFNVGPGPAYNATPAVGPYDQERGIPEPFDEQYRIYNGTVTYKLGFATLTSITGYQTMHYTVIQDAPNYQAYCAYGGFSCAYAGVPNENNIKKFTQEVRLTSNSKGPLQWIIGGYYTHESSDWYVAIHGFNAADQQTGSVLDDHIPETYSERALFGDLTYHLTQKLEVTGGIRYFGGSDTVAQYGTGAFGSIADPRNSKESAFTYLANTAYHFSRNATAYFRYSTGYRPGGPEIITGTPIPGAPTSFKPDTLQSYEVGFKADALDHKLGVDISAYHIDWSNIHDVAQVGAFAGIVNGGNATINGTEINLTARPISELRLKGSFTYIDGHTDGPQSELSGLGAYVGERLPNSPKTSVVLDGEYTFPGPWHPSLGATLRAEGDRYSSFNASPYYPQVHLPAYTTVDLRAGLTIHPVDISFYIRNLTNKLIEESAFTEYSAAGQASIGIAPPRTFGVSGTVRF